MSDEVDRQVERLREWLLSRQPDCERLELDTDLLDGGVLADSLEFIAFLMEVEDVRGVPIETDDVDLESFRTLAKVRDAFLVPEAAP